jgi:FkbM family methyltransferase
MKYIRKLLIKNKFLYAFVKFLYVNLNPIIIKRSYINYQLGKFLDALLRDLENIKFIQVGSNDGIQNDPLRKYILNKDTWSGLLIEPVPNIFLNLEKLYENNSRVTVLNCAISDESSKILEFFFVSDDAKILGEGLPAWYNQLGSFDKNNIIKHFDGLLEPYIISESVKIRTLDSLAEEYGSFQFLHI